MVVGVVSYVWFRPTPAVERRKFCPRGFVQGGYYPDTANATDIGGCIRTMSSVVKLHINKPVVHLVPTYRV